MRPAEIEHWAMSVVDAIVDGNPAEDMRVEVKREWPEVARMARRLAGHANAARGAPILWIIGVDEEKRDVIGARRKDAQEWYRQLEKEFDGPAPTLVDLVFRHNDKTLMALFFETTRAPFVVRTGGNKAGEGQVQFEVPWRSGTIVRSARREDLLRVLVPVAATPTCEVRGAVMLHISPGQTDDCRLMVDLFLIHESPRPACIPFYGIELEVRSGEQRISFSKRRRIEWAQMFEGLSIPAEMASHTVKIAAHEAHVSGPGMVVLSGEANVDSHTVGQLARSPIHVRYRIPITGAPPILGEAALKPTSRRENLANQVAAWEPA